VKRCIITDQVNSDFEEALRKCKKLGYTQVEVHSLWGKTIETLSDAEVTKVKELLCKNQIQLTCLSTTLFMMVPLRQNDILSKFNPGFAVAEGNYEDHLLLLKRTLDIADRLDCPNIRIFPFRAPDNRVVIGDDDDQFLIIEKLREPVRMAEKRNKVLLLENCPYSHLPKGTMTKKIIEHFQSPALQLLWDPANSYRAVKDRIPRKYLNSTLDEELKLIYKSIGHIHIKDYKYILHEPKPFKHVILGQGDIDYKTILHSLKEKDYHGSLSLEPEVNAPDTIVSMIVFSSMMETLNSRH